MSINSMISVLSDSVLTDFFLPDFSWFTAGLGFVVVVAGHKCLDFIILL